MILLDEKRLSVSDFDFQDSFFPFGFLLTTPYPEYRIVYANEFIIKLLGYHDFQEMTTCLKGQAISFVHASDLERIKMAGSEQVGCFAPFETLYRLVRKDNSFIWVSHRSEHALSNDGQEMIISYIGNITNILDEEHETNRQLTAALIKAEQATSAKNEFLSRMSHDIRTPMNSIMGITTIAQHDNHDPLIADYLSKIRNSSKFLLGLINDILDLSKIEEGSITFHPEPYTFIEFKNIIDTIIGPLMDEKRIHFNCNLCDNPQGIFVDKLRFNQIFFNLLSNASKFTPEGGTVVFASECLGCDGKELRLRFIVRDDGIGMSREFLNHVFEPFAQENNNLILQRQGTGLGLLIVKRLVDLMKGTINIASERGKGTEITVEMTVPVVSLSSSMAIKATEENHNWKLQGKRILLVEDNLVNSEVARRMLAYQGVDVDTAFNGQEALDRFTSRLPFFYDAILMDIIMPVMDGFQATHALRTMAGVRPDAKSIPIIAMTASVFESERKKSKEAGMDAYLIKPIEMQLLYQTLADWIKT